MEIKVFRPQIQDSPRTISKMFIDGEYFCDVLEDKDRDLHYLELNKIKRLKIKHQTAIPYGKYEVVLSFSNRFEKLLPLLRNVPGFDGIRIHAGNTEADTSGCLLLGVNSGKSIKNSRVTMESFMRKIQKAITTEKVFIEIIKYIDKP